MRKSRSKSPLIKFAQNTAYVLFLFTALGIGTIIGWIHQSPVVSSFVNQTLFNRAPQQAFGDKDNLIVLLLGCDEDLYFGGKQVTRHAARSDMMLLANFDFKNHRISGLSIPRDLRVKYPGKPAHKINAFHAIAPWGQEDKWTKDAVEYMFPGVHIDKVLTLDFDAFENLVNMVGGVTLTIDKKMDYDDNAGNVHAHFIPGVINLNGYQAEMFVRFRHADNDWERQRRQKEFLVAFKDALLKNKTSLMQITEAGKKVFGQTLTDDQMAAIAKFATSVASQDIHLSEMPSHPGHGTWVVLDDKRKVEQALLENGLVSAPPNLLSDAR